MDRDRLVDHLAGLLEGLGVGVSVADEEAIEGAPGFPAQGTREEIAAWLRVALRLEPPRRLVQVGDRPPQWMDQDDVQEAQSHHELGEGPRPRILHDPALDAAPAPGEGETVLVAPVYGTQETGSSGYTPPDLGVVDEVSGHPDTSDVIREAEIRAHEIAGGRLDVPTTHEHLDAALEEAGLRKDPDGFLSETECAWIRDWSARPLWCITHKAPPEDAPPPLHCTAVDRPGHEPDLDGYEGHGSPGEGDGSGSPLDCTVEGCGRTDRHYHRGTLDGEEIVRLDATPPMPDSFVESMIEEAEMRRDAKVERDVGISPSEVPTIPIQKVDPRYCGHVIGSYMVDGVKRCVSCNTELPLSGLEGGSCRS